MSNSSKNIFKSQIQIVNRTSMSDLEHFLRQVCFTYLMLDTLNKKKEEASMLTLSDISNEELLDVLDMKEEELFGFNKSNQEFLQSLFHPNSGEISLYRNFIGEYYFYNFEPTDYEILNDEEILHYSKSKYKEMKHLSATSPGWVNVTNDLQATLAAMSVEEAFPELVINKVVEHDCVVRNEIDYKIAFIHLFLVKHFNNVPSNLYLIEGDSFNPDEAIMSAEIGETTQIFENLDSKRKHQLNSGEFKRQAWKKAA